MAIEDRIKWDKKYEQNPNLLKQRQASKKLINILDKTKGFKALEVACGAGRNSIYLAQNGFEVEAFDISKLALDTLNEKGFGNIKTKLVDLENYTPNENSYNLIVMTNFLDRKLIPKLAKALQKDGILVIETYMSHESNNKPSFNPDFLLQKNELKTFFSKEYEVLEYDEFDNEVEEMYKMRKQSICVKRL